MIALPKIGDHIDIYWPKYNQFYPGTVKNINENGGYNVDCFDGDTEKYLYMTKEISKIHSQQPAMTSNQIELQSNEKEVIDIYIYITKLSVTHPFYAMTLKAYLNTQS